MLRRVSHYSTHYQSSANGRDNLVRSGFTLLELLISLAIALIAIAGIIKAVGNGLVVVQSISRRTQALNLAKMKIEELLMTIDDQPNEQEGDFGGSFQEFRWRSRISEAPVEGLKVVTITVTWLDGASERELSLSTAVGPEKLTSLPPPEGSATQGVTGELTQENTNSTHGGERSGTE